MIDVYLDVDGQALSVSKRPEHIIAGTNGAIRLNFSFSQDWCGYLAVADFDGIAVPILRGSCTVPDDVTSGIRFGVRVVGIKDGARNRTNQVHIKQELEV